MPTAKNTMCYRTVRHAITWYNWFYSII